jgi:hypothetical protein
MRKKLFEVADIDLAIAKSLTGANLSPEEVDSLYELTTRDLMIDHELDHVLAKQVVNHTKAQDYRLNAQNLYTPIEDYEPKSTSMTRTYPMNEVKRPSSRDFRRLVLQVLKEERSR